MTLKLSVKNSVLRPLGWAPKTYAQPAPEVASVLGAPDEHSLLWIDYPPTAYSLELEPEQRCQPFLSRLFGMPVSGFAYPFDVVLEGVPGGDVVIVLRGQVAGRLPEEHAERLHVALDVHNAKAVRCSALVRGGKTRHEIVEPYRVCLAMSLECPVVFRRDRRLTA